MQAMQLNLFDADVPLRAANDNDNDWKAKFEEFHADNPHIYELVKKYAFEVIATGRDHFSMISIFERIRWFTTVETTGDEFKINQNYATYYGRKFMDDFPQHEGFFRTRALRSK